MESKTSMEFAEVGDGYVVGELGGELLESALRNRQARHVEQLERAVILAVTQWRRDMLDSPHAMSGQSHHVHFTLLIDAVDALLKGRENK